MFALEPAEWMYNPIGMVHGGIAATILDSCMGCAVHTTLAAGVGYTTTDLQVRYIRAMSDVTGRVLAEGRVVHAGRRTATAEGRAVRRVRREADRARQHRLRDPRLRPALCRSAPTSRASWPASPRRARASASSASLGSSGTIAPLGTRWPSGSQRPMRTDSAARMTMP